MKTKEELWNDFFRRYNKKSKRVNAYIGLLTREYKNNLERLNVTAKSSDKLKEEAENLPISVVHVGFRNNEFFCEFAFGNDVMHILNPKGTLTFKKSGFSTPEEAYEAVLNEASKYNK